ncbi:MAG: formylglycine-generating enzyme family protein [Planctomycetota bacterium]|nr:formylglycine-generating enzyme family protein [Planctomycetota bacterium]
MSDAFNPYHRWLGIPPKYQPPDHYRLLGVERLESDFDVIRDASERQISHVRRYASGEHRDSANRVLNELATARACLLNSASKAAYDEQLRAQIAEQNPPPPHASSIPATTSPVQRSRRRQPRSPRVEVVKIVMGGIAGLAIGVLLLWYGFGVDVLRVMESRDEGTAKPIAQNDANAHPKPPLTPNVAPANARWQILRPTTLEALHGTKLSALEDSSVLASGVSAETNTYVLTATSPLNEITGIQIEAIPDSSLPANGPGRTNGNFVLTEFKVFVIGSDGGAIQIALQNASASFEQSLHTLGDKENPYKKYNAASAIDGDVKGKRWGWAIHPHVGKPHRVVVETAEPISGSEIKLRITIDQQHGTQHTLGRFRLAVTSSPPPFSADGDAVSSVPMQEESTVSDGPTTDPLPGAPLSDGFAPPLAVAPFDAVQAREHQQAWADYLGVPVEISNSLEMKLRLIPPGDFAMGSAENEEGRNVDEHLHLVQISHAFYLAEHEVTVGQFERFVAATGYRTEAERDGAVASGWSEARQRVQGSDPIYSWQNTGFVQTEKHPVVNVSWSDAVAFCKWLGRQEQVEYGLPTEAQWEFACRAGSGAAYSFGDDSERLAEHANVADRTAKLKFTNYPDWAYIANVDGYAFTAPVGSFKTNAWGLYDVHGNVWELCRDWYDAEYYELSPRADPDGPLLSNGSLHESEEQKRVCRGGGWSARTYTEYRSASRIGFAVCNRSLSTGFRVMRTMEAGKSAHDFKVMRNSIGMKLVLIPAGDFLIGSHESPAALAGEFGAKVTDFTALSAHLVLNNF